VEEVDQLAEEVLAPVKEPPAPMTRRQAGNMRRVANGFYCAVVVLSFLLGVMLLLNTFAANGVLGVRFFVETTNAMRGEVPRGSLLITVTRASGKIQAGDIVTYYAVRGDPGTRLTRIVHERVPNDNGLPLFRTKRAGNAAPDSMLINMTHILGVKLAVLPGVGYVISFLQSYGWGIFILIVTLVVSAVALRRWANTEHPELKKKKRKKSNRKGRERHAFV